MNRVLFPVVVAVLVGLAGCGKSSFSQGKDAAKQNVFRYPIVTNPTTLDPGIVQDGDTIDLLQQVYEGLVMWGEDNTVKPNLAESWEVKNNGKTYVFKIRKGVKFHNGREVKAEDFKWSLERNCSHALSSPVATNYLNDIVGVMDHFAGKINDIPGVKVIDDYTLQIDLIQPRAYFLGKLTYIGSAVIAKESVPADKEINSITQGIGTGPFKFENYVPEQIVVLAANPDYHGGAPKVAKIERPVIKDAVTRLNKYKAGEIDLVQLERQDIDGVKADAALKDHLKFFDRPSIYYVGMNPKGQPQFKDVRVRRAIAMAIDKERIVNDFLGGVNKVANSIVPPGVLGHRDNAASLPFDPSAAKAELAAAGFPGGKGLPALEIRFREQRPDIRIVAEAVASDLKKNLGIQVNLQSMEWRSYLEKWDKGEIGFFHMRWAADYLDCQNFLSHMLSTTGPENRGVNYSNAKFDQLCAQADASVDQDERLKLYAQAEDLALQEAPWVPIYFQRDAELINPRVQGLRESLFGHLPHTTVSVGQ